MISKKHRCIFVHIPKTAGTSLSQALGLFDRYKHEVQDHRTLREMKPMNLNDLRIGLTHKSHYYSRKRLLSYYFENFVLGHHEIDQAEYQQFYKFTFVRNPWARLYSWFNNLMQEENRQKHHVPEDYTFEKFVKEGMRLDIRILQGYWKQKKGELYKESTFAYYNPVLPQMHWIKDWQENVPLDFIGRFENLHNDWNHVCDQINLDNRQFDWIMRSPVSGSEYKKAFDQEMRDIVERYYQEDINFFDYEFDQ